MVKGWQVLPDGALSCRVCCHSRCAGMDDINHWIPVFAGMTARRILAFAGRLRASLAACSRIPCILVGVSINDGEGNAQSLIILLIIVTEKHYITVSLIQAAPS